MVSSCKGKHSLSLLLGHEPQIPKKWVSTNCLSKRWQMCFYIPNTTHIWIAKCNQLSIHCLSAPNPASFALLGGAEAGCCNKFSLPAGALPLPVEGAERAGQQAGATLPGSGVLLPSCYCPVVNNLQAVQWRSRSSGFPWHPRSLSGALPAPADSFEPLSHLALAYSSAAFHRPMWGEGGSQPQAPQWGSFRVLFKLS